MFRALNTASLGMNAQQKMVDNISNNLANVNTTAFKNSRIAFQDLFYENVPVSRRGTNEQSGDQQAAPLQIGHGSRAVATIRNFTQGPISETGNPLDMAVHGEGFFQVEMPDGSIAYTRDGNFTMDQTGRLVTNGGLPLADQIEVPEDAVAIEVSQNGVVTAKLSNNAGTMELGQIEMARFMNQGGLEAIGDNLYARTEASGDAFYGTPGSDGFGAVKQGYLEDSNVDIVNEMVELIEAQRAYETNSKMVQTAEDMMSITNQIKR